VVFVRSVAPVFGDVHSVFIVCDGHMGVGAAQHCVNHMPGLLNQLLPPHLPDWTVDRWVLWLWFCVRWISWVRAGVGLSGTRRGAVGFGGWGRCRRYASKTRQTGCRGIAAMEGIQ
jgi:hypothetical protein